MVSSSYHHLPSFVHHLWSFFHTLPSITCEPEPVSPSLSCRRHDNRSSFFFAFNMSCPARQWGHQAACEKIRHSMEKCSNASGLRNIPFRSSQLPISLLLALWDGWCWMASCDVCRWWAQMGTSVIPKNKPKNLWIQQIKHRFDQTLWYNHTGDWKEKQHTYLLQYSTSFNPFQNVQIVKTCHTP